MSFLRKLRTLRSLDRATRALGGALDLSWRIVEAGFHTAGVAATQRFLCRWARPPKQSPVDVMPTVRLAARAVAIARVTRRAPVWPVHDALGLAAPARHRNRIFAWASRRRNGLIEGHAWVEHGGRPLNEDPSTVGTYTPCADSVRFDLWLASAGGHHV